jgi:hypothetical protein
MVCSSKPLARRMDAAGASGMVNGHFCATGRLTSSTLSQTAADFCGPVWRVTSADVFAGKAVQGTTLARNPTALPPSQFAACATEKDSLAPARPAGAEGHPARAALSGAPEYWSDRGAQAVLPTTASRSRHKSCLGTPTDGIDEKCNTLRQLPPLRGKSSPPSAAGYLNRGIRLWLDFSPVKLCSVLDRFLHSTPSPSLAAPSHPSLVRRRSFAFGQAYAGNWSTAVLTTCISCLPRPVSVSCCQTSNGNVAGTY